VAWGSRRWWPWLARRVTGHPQAVLAVGSLALAVPALVSLRLEPHYGAVFDLPAHAPAKRAFRLIEQHFSKGQLDSATLLLEFAAGTQLDADRLSAQIAAALQASPGVANVYALSTPLGEAPGSASLPAFLLSLARGYYLSQSAAGAPVLRFEILMNDLPATRAAATTLQRAATTARQLAAPYSPTVLLAGPTAYILNERNIADADQRRVIVLATVVIAIIVLAIVRDVPLTLFMVLATWLTYGATLTLSDLFFVHVLGLAGLDWKVRLILFVIVVAVGQDYNIFLVTRLREEVRHQAALPATQAAIVRTGPVISSCGLIMAATLGSLVAGGLPLLRELGLALALGILIDTFFVRPLLIPAFFLVFGRRRRDGAPAGGRGPAGV
jgi:RND superfamily putative drug exporter